MAGEADNMDMWRKQKDILEHRIVELEIEADELREENRQMANNLMLAKAQIKAMNTDRNYPDLKAVS